MFAVLEAKNEPWPQSWKTMKVRSAKPEAGTAIASISQNDWSSAHTITGHSSRYGTTEVARSSSARPRSGVAYGAISARYGLFAARVGAASLSVCIVSSSGLD